MRQTMGRSLEGGRGRQRFSHQIPADDHHDGEADGDGEDDEEGGDGEAGEEDGDWCDSRESRASASDS